MPLLQSRSALPLSITLVIGLFAFFPLWLGRGIAYSPSSDIIAEHLSNMEVYTRSVREEGRFPLWNPAMNCGAPGFANPQSMILYPLSVLYLVVSPERATNLFILLSYLGAGAAMFAVGRRTFTSTWVAAFCALAYMVSFRSFAMIYAGWLPKMAMFTLAPLLFWSAWRMLERTTPARVTVFALIVALGWVQGDMQLFAYCMAGVGATLASNLARRPPGDRVRIAVAAGAGLILGTLLAAPATLPRIEFVQLSTRTSPNYEFFLSASPGAGDAATFLSPREEGGRRTEFWEGNFYFGLGLYPFCGIALVTRFRRAWLPALALIAAVFLCFDSPILRFLFAYLPGFSLFRQPSRALILGQFAAVYLAALGLDALIASRATPNRERRLAAVMAASFATLAVLCLATHAGAISIAVAVVGAAAAALIVATPKYAWVLVAVLAFVAPADAALRMGPLIKTLPVDQAFPPASFHQPLMRSPDSGRTAAIGRTAVPYGQAGHFRIDLLNGYASLNLRHYFEYLVVLQTGRVDGAEISPLVWTEFVAAARPDMLRALDIRHIAANEQVAVEPIGYRPAASYPEVPVFDFYHGITPVPVFVFDDPGFGAPGHYAQAIRPVSTAAESIAAVASNATTVANILGDAPRDPLDFKGGTIRYARRGLNLNEYEVEAAGREFIILSQIWYPGWRAALDGQPVPVFRVNHALIGCVVSSGKHRLVLEMTSPMLVRGLWLSVFAAAMLVALNTIGRSRLATRSGQVKQ